MGNTQRKTCHCGSRKKFEDCCEPFLLGKTVPKSAEQLMRSRFTAYKLHDYMYISQTMTGRAMENFSLEDARQDNAHVKWLSLKVLNSQENNLEASVTFSAQYELDGNRGSLDEKSYFIKRGGRWFYVDAEHR